MKRFLTLFVGLGCLALGMELAQAQTHLILNSTYVPPPPDRGWVRVAPSGWKHSMDDAITNTSLIKFDISAIPPGATIQSAKLGFYIQKSEEGYTTFVRWVDNFNDSWSYLNNSPEELRGWGPTSLIAQYPTGQVGLKEINVTSWIQQEIDLGDILFSVKFDHGSGDEAWERIASPDAWYSPHRPYLDVVFTSPQTVNADLTLSRHDIKFTPMWPMPYEPVTIEATVHNVGGSLTSGSFWVEFWDGTNFIDHVRITNPIPGGGGTAIAQITWYPSEGLHDIKVIADPNNPPPGEIIEIRDDNNSNADLSNDGEAYTYEVRPQYKFYAESFETGFGRWQKDADQSGPQLWDVTRVSGSAYEGSYYLQMYLQTTFDNGTVWIERPIPIPADPDAVGMVELSFFAHDGGGLYANNTKMWGGWYDPDLDEDLWMGNQLSPSTWRRFRSYSFLGSVHLPEYWVGGGYHQYQTNSTPNEFFDLYTVRVNPPRSSMDLATAYNNGTKLVWDGLSTHHLIYVSGDSILYSRSEDPAGDTWSDAEFVGFVVPGQYPAIALAPDGYPRAVWSNGLNLYYSKRSDTGWQSPPQEWLFL